jgi:chromosome segregation ATPase
MQEQLESATGELREAKEELESATGVMRDYTADLESTVDDLQKANVDMAELTTANARIEATQDKINTSLYDFTRDLINLLGNVVTPDAVGDG